MHHLAMHFEISVVAVHNVINRIIPRLHAFIVPKYVKWHSMGHWRRLSGFFPEWPNVVGIMDCTPFRISRPTGCFDMLTYSEFLVDLLMCLIK